MRLNESIANNKFRLKRGQEWVSLAFWATTTVNLILLNLKAYFDIPVGDYLLLGAAGLIASLGGVWLIGYFDVRYKVYSHEVDLSQRLSPILKEMSDNNKAILAILRRRKDD